ncbi:YqaA family protein [Arenibaculum sp.]|jgi:membrane protein YqaA with SNARE-associated domain|uniref:YqaA family protein n=1 Tax=Arenibaculum sp. TaxID=2865862 RepID=UPI002E14C20D|nr:YqaA family protein [Arenibaculum sp.]
MDAAAFAGLFLAAFLAATVLPAQSELALAGLVAAGAADPVLLVAVASVGNTAGSCVNWALGRGLERLRRTRRLRIPEAQYARAERWYRRFGIWSLLFAWVPVVGDPLTVVAGALRTPFLPFLFLVGIGKTARYAVLAGFTDWFLVYSS